MAMKSSLRPIKTKARQHEQFSTPYEGAKAPLSLLLLGYLLADLWFGLYAYGERLKSLRQRCADWLEG